MKKLLITGCTDRNMWYSGLVGKEVPFLREEADAFMSREPAGFVNFVRKADGRLVEDDLQPVGLLNWAEGQKAIGTKAPANALGRLAVHVETNLLGFPVVIDPTVPPHQVRLASRPVEAPRVYGSAREWAEASRSMLPPLLVRRRAAGPGWLDGETPCVCERVMLMHGGRTLSIHMIEQLIARPIGSDGIRTFDPQAKGTNDQ